VSNNTPSIWRNSNIDITLTSTTQISHNMINDKVPGETMCTDECTSDKIDLTLISSMEKKKQDKPITLYIVVHNQLKNEGTFFFNVMKLFNNDIQMLTQISDTTFVRLHRYG